MDYSNKTSPLYLQIYGDLKTLIEQNHYEYESFLPAERVLSTHYKVERLTLRKALSLLAQQGYIEKLPGAGNKVIYKSMTSEPIQGIANAIVYVLPDMANERVAQPYHMEICNYLEKYCKNDNLDLIFTKVSSNQSTPSFLQNPAAIRGIIWVGDINPEFLEIARKGCIPSIVVSNNYPYFPRINMDDINCGYSATCHLIEQGCKRIVHITGFPNYISTFNRSEGYRRALLVNGLEVLPELTVQGDWNFSSGYSSVMDLIEKGIAFDGIMASNDMMALGAMKAVITSGLKVPEDIKIIGIDNIEQSKISIPALSTICVEQKSIAKLAFLFLKQIMEGASIPDEILIPGKLIKRETS
ncbi:GntR family transcriptional regulator [Cellulosilyticum sp. I15G10I2]|uniref:GntR family transcriptional regulator n=1 Tax=Cellulosilyticum sp. I15G10I2 TaxID=1892843 RepID=UPI00085C4E46|nr:substrate-binding domain-containing protein [Cellulosilyticum sp. I15G10I2]